MVQNEEDYELTVGSTYYICPNTRFCFSSDTNL